MLGDGGTTPNGGDGGGGGMPKAKSGSMKIGKKVCAYSLPCLQVPTYSSPSFVNDLDPERHKGRTGTAVLYELELLLLYISHDSSYSCRASAAATTAAAQFCSVRLFAGAAGCFIYFDITFYINFPFDLC